MDRTLKGGQVETEDSGKLTGRENSLRLSQIISSEIDASIIALDDELE